MNETTAKVSLSDLGFDDFSQKNPDEQNNADLVPARIISQHKGAYVLRNDRGEFLAKIKGRLVFESSSKEDYPVVGDWVWIEILDDTQALIHEIFPRKTILGRKAIGVSSVQLIAANVDVAFIVQSPDRDYSLNRYERYLSLVKNSNIEPVIILNKSDLLSPIDFAEISLELETRFPEVSVYAVSAVNLDGVEDIKATIKAGTTYCFLGSSGVGKSSLINAFIGEDIQKTGEISESANRGKHVTTHRELFVLSSGGLLIDNPGMREIGVLDSEEGINSVFDEINELSAGCRFSDCRHMDEPQCAVVAALEAGDLSKEKYDNFVKLSKENEHNTMNNFERRNKDRKFAKFLKNSKKDLKKFRGR